LIKLEGFPSGIVVKQESSSEKLHQVKRRDTWDQVSISKPTTPAASHLLKFGCDKDAGAVHPLHLALLDRRLPYLRWGGEKRRSEERRQALGKLSIMWKWYGCSREKTASEMYMAR
jgi:hypothetical protein